MHYHHELHNQVTNPHSFSQSVGFGFISLSSYLLCKLPHFVSSPFHLVSSTHSCTFIGPLKVWVPWDSALGPFASLFLSLYLSDFTQSQGFKNIHMLTTWQHIYGFPFIPKSFKWWVQNPPPPFQNSKGRADKPRSWVAQSLVIKSNWQNSPWHMKLEFPKPGSLQE